MLYHKRYIYTRLWSARFASPQSLVSFTKCMHGVCSFHTFIQMITLFCKATWISFWSFCRYVATLLSVLASGNYLLYVDAFAFLISCWLHFVSNFAFFWSNRLCCLHVCLLFATFFSYGLVGSLKALRNRTRIRILLLLPITRGTCTISCIVTLWFESLRKHKVTPWHTYVFWQCCFLPRVCEH